MGKLSITKSETPTGAAPGSDTKYPGCAGVGVPSGRTCRGLGSSSTGVASRRRWGRGCVRRGRVGVAVAGAACSTLAGGVGAAVAAGAAGAGDAGSAVGVGVGVGVPV